MRKEEVSQWLSYASKVYNKRGRGAYFASVARFDTQNTGLTLFSFFICLVCKQPMSPYITLVIFTSHQNRMEYKSCDRKKETFRKSSRVFCCCSSFVRNARVFNR